MEQQKNAVETAKDETEQDYIYLSFQDGEPLLISNQTQESEIASELNFYGAFWIHENDYLVFTATPMTSFQKYYKMPEGTYRKVAEMIKK